MSCIVVRLLPCRKNCAWLKRLKTSKRKLTPTRSVARKFLISEKSVLTKSGPVTGARFALPSSPTVDEDAFVEMNAHGLNQLLRVWIWAGALQPGLPATGPA